MDPLLGEKIEFSGGRLQDLFVPRDKFFPAASTTTAKQVWSLYRVHLSKHSIIACHTKFAHSLHYVK